jgi:hypothetical protein
LKKSSENGGGTKKDGQLEEGKIIGGGVAAKDREGDEPMDTDVRELLPSSAIVKQELQQQLQEEEEEKKTTAAPTAVTMVAAIPDLLQLELLPSTQIPAHPTVCFVFVFFCLFIFIFEFYNVFI